jgi:molecular chaperone DnaJ
MLRLKNQGASQRGSKPGDLYVVVHVEQDKTFERLGDDILLELTISITQAALGAEIEVPTLLSKAKLKIPSGTQPDTILRLKGQGMPRTRWKGKGDQLVQIRVKVPKKLNRRQRELLEELSGEFDSR